MKPIEEMTDVDEIDRYIEGTLTDEQTNDFQQKLLNDPQLRIKVSLRRIDMASYTVRHGKHAPATVPVQPADPLDRKMHHYTWILAAGVAAIIITLIFLLAP
jgi:hypothetical protein